MKNQYRIVIDLGGLDGLWPGAGLFRYVVDLIHALAELRLAGVQFFILGAFEEPIADLAQVFCGAKTGQFVYVPFRRATGIGSMLRDQLSLGLILARLRPDLCHCLHTAAPALAPCPLVVTIQDMMFELFPEYAAAVRSRPYRLFRWITRHRVARAICASFTTAADLHRLWRISRERLDVVYHGVRVFGGDDQPVSDRPENPILAGIHGSGSIVISPLNLEPRKNLVLLLEAYSWLLPRWPDAKLVLFGKGGWAPDREEKYAANLRRLGLAERVIQTGVLSDADLRWLYRHAAVFAFPTLYEGFGYPVLEAMTCGTPPVVRGLSSMAEVAGDAGVLVEPLTAMNFGNAILRLLSDDYRRRKLGEFSRQRARQFTSRRMAEQTYAVYMSVLSGRRGAFRQLQSGGLSCARHS